MILKISNHMYLVANTFYEEFKYIILCGLLLIIMY